MTLLEHRVLMVASFLFFFVKPVLMFSFIPSSFSLLFLLVLKYQFILVSLDEGLLALSFIPPVQILTFLLELLNHKLYGALDLKSVLLD